MARPSRAVTGSVNPAASLSDSPAILVFAQFQAKAGAMVSWLVVETDSNGSVALKHHAFDRQLCRVKVALRFRRLLRLLYDWGRDGDGVANANNVV